MAYRCLSNRCDNTGVTFFVFAQISTPAPFGMVHSAIADDDEDDEAMAHSLIKHFLKSSLVICVCMSFNCL